MNSLRLTLLPILSLIIAGCAAGSRPSVVPDAQGEKYIPAVRMSCVWPYELDRDCSPNTGPLAKLAIPGVNASLAGGEDGKVIVVFGDESGESVEQSSNLAYRHVKEALTKHGVGIVRVMPIMAVGNVLGYAIETDKAAYHLLPTGDR
jgi:hypothetical protein